MLPRGSALHSSLILQLRNGLLQRQPDVRGRREAELRRRLERLELVDQIETETARDALALEQRLATTDDEGETGNPFQALVG